LNQLALQGRLVRTLGGAVPVGGHEPEFTLSQRKNLHKSKKEAIARAAVAEIRDGETIILDSGTTTNALAVQLRGRFHLRVITNNLQVIATLANDVGIDLVMIGGTVRQKSHSTIGPLAEIALRRLTADRVFLGADGIVAKRGLCEASSDQIQLKEVMMAQSTKIYVLADSSKLGRAAQQAWAPLNIPWTLITDVDAEAEQIEAFRTLRDVTVMVAK
jgi:DeoR/GlpR family transcriptional regulator of sugar metabolism